jgi:ribonucleotide reductase alpha subunit
MYDRRYLINPFEYRELPQHLYMVNAMFLGIPENKENRLDFVKKLYRSTAT